MHPPSTGEDPLCDCFLFTGLSDLLFLYDNPGITPLNLYASHFLVEQDGFHLHGGKTSQCGPSSGFSYTCLSPQLHPV